jgi:hypothetical protein
MEITPERNNHFDKRMEYKGDRIKYVVANSVHLLTAYHCPTIARTRNTGKLRHLVPAAVLNNNQETTKKSEGSLERAGQFSLMTQRVYTSQTSQKRSPELGMRIKQEDQTAGHTGNLPPIFTSTRGS